MASFKVKNIDTASHAIGDTTIAPGVTKTVSEADWYALSAPTQPFFSVVGSVDSAAVLKNVTSSATNVTLLSSSSNRKGSMVYNDSTSVLYLKLGAVASATSFTISLAAGGYYEVP